MTKDVTNVLTIFGPNVDKVKENIAAINDRGNIVPNTIDFNRIIPTPEELEIQLGSFTMTDELFEWRYNNWGVKWNASNEDTKPIHFITPWHPPVPAIMKLSQQYPDNRFILEVGGEHDPELFVFEKGNIVYKLDHEFDPTTDLYYNLLLDNGLSPYTCGYRYTKNTSTHYNKESLEFFEGHNEEEFW